MKLTKFKVLVVGMILSTSISLTACKSKAKDSDNAGTTTTAPAPEAAPAPAPVVISADDSLRTGVTDATKDFPGVKADVANGEITLTGTIQRSRLQTLMQSLHSLRPKKINNNLTIK